MDLTGPFKKYFRRQPKASPTSDFLVRLVSEVKAFQDQGNIPEMLRVSLEALRMPGVADHPAFFRYFANVAGVAWFRTDEYGPGIRFFRDYVREHSDDDMGYRMLGHLLWYSGQLNEAYETYSSGLSRSLDSVELLSARGQVLADLQRYEEALSDLDRALEFLLVSEGEFSHRLKLQAYTRNGKGFALAGLGKRDLAFQEFQESINLQPENAWVYFNRAKVHEENKQFEQAVADYQLALKKREPRLSPPKKDHAMNRLSELAES